MNRLTRTHELLNTHLSFKEGMAYIGYLHHYDPDFFNEYADFVIQQIVSKNNN